VFDTVLVNESSSGTVFVEKIDPTNPNTHPIMSVCPVLIQCFALVLMVLYRLILKVLYILDNTISRLEAHKVVDNHNTFFQALL